MARKLLSASLIRSGSVKREDIVMRRAQPELKNARMQFKLVQREVAQLERSVRKAAVTLAKAEGDRAASKVARAVLTAQTRLLNAARKNELRSSRALAKLIAVDAERTRLNAQAKAMAVYKKKLAAEAESELARFLDRLSTAWQNNHYKADATRVAGDFAKGAVNAVRSRKRSMTKARLTATAGLLLAGSKVKKVKRQARKKLTKLSKKIGI